MEAASDESIFPEQLQELKEWVASGGKRGLGRDANKWLSLIEYSGHMALSADHPMDRQEFRSIALGALGDVRLSRILSGAEVAVREINLRVAYTVMNADDTTWARVESANIMDVFLDALPIGLEHARKKAKDWRHETSDVILDLRTVKNLAKPLRLIREHLDDSRIVEVDRWLNLLPFLP